MGWLPAPPPGQFCNTLKGIRLPVSYKSNKSLVWVKIRPSSGPITPLIHGGDARRFHPLVSTATPRLGLNGAEPKFGVELLRGGFSAQNTGPNRSVGTRKQWRRVLGGGCFAPRWRTYLNFAGISMRKEPSSGSSSSKLLFWTGYSLPSGHKTLREWYPGRMHGRRMSGLERPWRIRSEPPCDCHICWRCQQGFDFFRVSPCLAASIFLHGFRVRRTDLTG